MAGEQKCRDPLLDFLLAQSELHGRHGTAEQNPTKHLLDELCLAGALERSLDQMEGDVAVDGRPDDRREQQADEVLPARLVRERKVGDQIGQLFTDVLAPAVVEWNVE